LRKVVAMAGDKFADTEWLTCANKRLSKRLNRMFFEEPGPTGGWRLKIVSLSNLILFRATRSIAFRRNVLMNGDNEWVKTLYLRLRPFVFECLRELRELKICTCAPTLPHPVCTDCPILFFRKGDETFAAIQRIIINGEREMKNAMRGMEEFSHEVGEQPRR
jgi:hypothetical protein